MAFLFLEVVDENIINDPCIQYALAHSIRSAGGVMGRYGNN